MRSRSSVNFVERIDSALPELAAARDPRNLELERAPKLRSIVLRATPRGRVPRVPGVRSGLRHRCGDRCPSQPGPGTGARCLHDSLHQRHDLESEGVPFSSRSHGPRPASSSASTASCSRTQDKMWSPLPLFHIAAMLPLSRQSRSGRPTSGCSTSSRASRST